MTKMLFARPILTQKDIESRRPANPFAGRQDNVFLEDNAVHFAPIPTPPLQKCGAFLDESIWGEMYLREQLTITGKKGKGMGL
jgi:hypothetical protein